MDRGKDRETAERSYSKGPRSSHQSLLGSLSAILTAMGGAQEPAFTHPWRSTFEEPLMTGSCLQTWPGPPEVTWQGWEPG